MQIKYTKFQKELLGMLAMTRSPLLAQEHNLWCFACEAAATARVNERSGVSLCSSCGQATLVPVTERLERLRPALEEFAEWLLEQYPEPDPRTPTKLPPPPKDALPKTGWRYKLREALYKDGLLLKGAASKREKQYLGQFYLMREYPLELARKRVDLKALAKEYGIKTP